MIDFRKRLDAKQLEKKLHPVEIYESLDRKSDKGPLRPAQFAVLSTWFETLREQRDLIVKLHTGQGKTLVGLLLLQSRLNEGKGPALYLCPNIYLAEQTREQAGEFGFKHCDIGPDNVIPADFWDGKAILITHVQRLFNGRSLFGLGRQAADIGAIVLDDSHACIETIRQAFTVLVKRDKAEKLYQELFALFEEDLQDQGLARVAEIRNGDTDVLLAVPYWAWQDRLEHVSTLLAGHKDDPELKFTWSLLRDVLRDCQCLVSGAAFEIVPYHPPMEVFGSFDRAQLRVFMSATTNDDSFFIKGLGLAIGTVTHPLLYAKEKWSGEKMLLDPYQLDDRLSRANLVAAFASPRPGRAYGVVALVPSFAYAETWKSHGAEVLTAATLDPQLKALKAGQGEKTVVIANRYDGIDLPDNACRILLLDSKPFAQTLSDRYQEECRAESDLIAIKTAQKIEQGLGRGVRGEKDYCVIVITGPDLINTLRNPRFRRFFSAQTRQQIEIGLNITKMAAEDATSGDGFQVINEVIKQCLSRDEGWKSYYADQMDEATTDHSNERVLYILELERKAEESYRRGDVAKAVTFLQTILDKHLPGADASERGWYLQEIARLLYASDKTESNAMQVAAHRQNQLLLKPRHGMVVTKLAINQSQAEAARRWLAAFAYHNDCRIRVDELLNNLTFGTKADKFEKALYDLGELLGFSSARPDKQWGAGPDNLWGVGENEYVLIECKNEVKEDRNEIHKAETGQMNNALAWFDREYHTMQVTPLMVIPVKNVAKEAGFSKDVGVVRKNSLKKLRDNVRSYINSFKEYELKDLTDRQVFAALETHKLTKEAVKAEYRESVYQR
ncbi:DEAD/DEAH box helicase [Hymenobacter convexus]|uniref:DEAD/DEAH box helicase n=1 Tax=Hymenobacter sp. CA1UV-4 TaxID=3063782 RepID=UPI0027130CB1|nr:DEAD/DEAH box helicase [Hymenobacter sp. CA1UV-4]MDO7854440.1 DEAD/DEAH box helicase family protein [Hymenobacter sp. CA1UV-4]